MRKSILLSIMAIGAVIAIAAGASTFATFTDTANVTSGTVTAGTVNIKVNAGDSLAIGAFDNTCARTQLGFNESCVATFVVTETGNLSVVLTDDFTTSSPQTVQSVAGCYSVSLTHGAYSTPDTTDLSSADAAGVTYTLTITLDDGGVPGNHANDNDCQGATVSVNTNITGTQSATPHD